ncbi:hypothetical protein [Candidatus Similichlamydia laticola]|uniref:hypothetical protein n=1 Tax=Candidatus Similichlamydia laticola TaxID=2170265 RepID=UPI0015F04830|nr:hypothetical protein [Candidatus Similichlamydia laticola]
MSLVSLSNASVEDSGASNSTSFRSCKSRNLSVESMTSWRRESVVLQVDGLLGDYLPTDSGSVSIPGVNWTQYSISRIKSMFDIKCAMSA